MGFLDELTLQTNRTYTENGAATNISTLDPVLDFFAVGGALRGQPGAFCRLFRLAYRAEPLTALRTLFYLRDVRGGQGERHLFRHGLADLAMLDEPTLRHNLHLVPEYGRWDDVFRFSGDSEIIGELIKETLDADLANLELGNSVTLMAKWLPSENASSPQTKQLAREIIEYLGVTPREYRKTLVKLRSYIGILEQQMSANQWDSIEYAKLPSQAHHKHVKAFNRHSEARYQAYLASVQKGDAKINTGTLFTYEVYNAAMYGGPQAKTADVMWENLPDYTQGRNSLVIADVSGSMSGHPMSVSVSLALYFAERNTGPFNGYFMTFSSVPQLVHISGITLTERLSNIQRSKWGMNTNLAAAFDVVLKAAVSVGASAEDIPASLYVISDMEFDQCIRGADVSLFEYARQKYAEAGFTLPHVVFWNVNARQTQAPALGFDGGVTLISGLSQSTFGYVMEGKTPRQLLDDVVNSPRYQPLQVV
jgi:hypothetical protein